MDTGYTLYTCGSNDASSGALVPLPTQLIIAQQPQFVTFEYSHIINMIHKINSTMYPINE